LYPASSILSSGTIQTIIPLAVNPASLCRRIAAKRLITPSDSYSSAFLNNSSTVIPRFLAELSNGLIDTCKSFCSSLMKSLSLEVSSNFFWSKLFTLSSGVNLLGSVFTMSSFTPILYNLRVGKSRNLITPSSDAICSRSFFKSPSGGTAKVNHILNS
jgi:hypothetical protein